MDNPQPETIMPLKDEKQQATIPGCGSVEYMVVVVSPLVLIRVMSYGLTKPVKMMACTEHGDDCKKRGHIRDLYIPAGEGRDLALTLDWPESKPAVFERTHVQLEFREPGTDDPLMKAPKTVIRLSANDLNAMVADRAQESRHASGG
jgi:hypothetical protein